MKKTLPLAFILNSILAFSQPVIQDANNVPAVGFSAPLTSASTTNVGNAGANQTWNFSTLSFTSLGTVNVIAPSSSPIGSFFPSANWAYSIGGFAYTFFENTATEMKNLASQITTTGGNGDYSANPKTIMQFPFSFGTTFTDTYINQGSTNSVTVTYDGYGTLQMPNGITYNNVIRVKEQYSSNADYRWYTTNPLLSVAVFNSNNNSLLWIGATPSSVNENANDLILNVFPNPANEKLTIELKNINFNENIKLNILNSLGQQVKQVVLTAETTNIELEGLSSGIYFVRIENDTTIIKTQKISIK